MHCIYSFKKLKVEWSIKHLQYLQKIGQNNTTHIVLLSLTRKVFLLLKSLNQQHFIVYSDTETSHFVVLDACLKLHFNAVSSSLLQLVHLSLLLNNLK